MPVDATGRQLRVGDIVFTMGCLESPHRPRRMVFTGQTVNGHPNDPAMIFTSPDNPGVATPLWHSEVWSTERGAVAGIIRRLHALLGEYQVVLEGCPPGQRG